MLARYMDIECHDNLMSLCHMLPHIGPIDTIHNVMPSIIIDSEELQACTFFWKVGPIMLVAKRGPFERNTNLFRLVTVHRLVRIRVWFRLYG